MMEGRIRARRAVPAAEVTVPDEAALTPAAARAVFRAGTRCPTAGWATGHAQANLIAVPRDWAYDVLLFAQRNPKPCPVLDVTDPGDPRTDLAPGADLRHDLPAYRIWEDGACVAEVADAGDHWRDDLVAFLIGCSFTFEAALLRAGVPVRHLAEGRNVPMYRTSQPCRPGGRLSGPLVVSMRPVPARLVPTAVAVTARFPAVHGAPVHVGRPDALGIADLGAPDFGDPVSVGPDELPVFWACGVTPQAAVTASRPPFAISHAPGHMFVTDVPDAAYET
jgi:uncharacterized protein YcsI (UPF0317 family)